VCTLITLRRAPTRAARRWRPPPVPIIDADDEEVRGRTPADDRLTLHEFRRIKGRISAQSNRNDRRLSFFSAFQIPRGVSISASDPGFGKLRNDARGYPLIAAIAASAISLFDPFPSFDARPAARDESHQ
jgi:hypothetical protein